MSDAGVHRVKEREVTKALRKSRLHGAFFCSRYSFSPYQGCGHGCLYCDGRAEKYYVEGEFDKDIVARDNIPQLLAKELATLREIGTVSIGSGVSDAYQPVEVSLELTRRCAEVLAEHSCPVVLATKSSLVERDIDLWGRIAQRAGFTLLMTIVMVDDDLRSEVEPGASSIPDRLRTLKRFKDAGASTGVLAMPVLPGLSDSETQLRELFGSAADAGVDCIIPGNLTLRPGRQKDLFLDYIRNRRPELVPLYEELYAEDRQSGNTTLEYRRRLYPAFGRLLDDLRLPAQIPHYAFKGRIPAPDEVHILLCHMIELYGRRGVDIGRLKRSSERFARWLDEKRRTFNRRRSLPPEWVATEFFSALERENRARALFDNRKLAGFVQSVVGEGRTLNYQSLELEAPAGLPES